MTRAPGIAGSQPPPTTKVPEAQPQYEAPAVPESQKAAEEEKEEASSQAKPEEKPPVEEAKKVGGPVIERLPELTISNVEAVVSGMLPKDMPSAIITKPEFTTDAAMYCSSEFFLTGIAKPISSYESPDLTILAQKAYEYSLANIKWSSKDSSIQKPEKLTSPGSLGSSLIAQALAAREYTGKSDWEGLLGLSLGLEMSDNVQFISDRLFFDGKSIGSLKDKPAGYVPHRVKVIGKEGKLNLEVTDKSSHLVDYAYLIWGMSEYLKAFKNVHPEGDVSRTRDRLIDLNLALYNNIKTRHYDSNTDTFIDTNDGKKGTKVSLSNAALSIVGLASFYESITDPATARSVELKMKGISKDVKSMVIKEADFIVHKLQGTTGEFHDGHLEGRALKKEGASISKDGLLIQVSGIRGLLAAWRLTGDKKYLEGAKKGFDYMDKNFRDENLMIYKSSLMEGDYIYTPVNVGMTVGALREMSNIEGYKDMALSRLSGFFDRIVEDAGLINIATGKNIIKSPDKERILKVAGKHPAIIPLLNSEVKIKQPVPESDKPETLIYDLAKSSVPDKSFPQDSGMLCSAEFYLTGMMNPSPRYEWTDMPILTVKAKSYAIENIKVLPKISDGFNKSFSSGSLGAGLLGQVLMSGIFKDKTGIEKAQGLELGMEMSKKIALLHDKLFFDGSSLGSLKDMPNSYVPHLITGVEKNGKLNLEVSDKASTLTDYAYLAWGLGEYLKICPPNIKVQVTNVGKALFSSIKDRHYDGDMATLIDVNYGKKSSRISMSNAALSIVGLASLYDGITDPEVKTMIIKEADFILNKLQEPAGEFSDGYWITHLLRKEGAETSKDGLLIQASGIRGLLAAWRLTGDKKSRHQVFVDYSLHGD
ncbi:MAG: hypothetical protein HYV48_01610 [Candidatus Omnitrophica bacterium]|nr:hypothetical protein [Candidatus Omnitrophota bacterium]